MSLDTNRKDFENALAEMEEVVSNINGIIDSDIIGVLETVVSEYQNHYQPDIDDLMDDKQDLQSKLDDLEQ